MANVSEVQTHVTENWNQLGSIYFKRFEFYEMEWRDLIDLECCLVVPANMGGYIAVALDSRKTNFNKHDTLGTMTPDKIYLYRPTGRQAGIIKWDGGGSIIGMTWTQEEVLVVVSEIGVMKKFDIHSTMKGQANTLLSTGNKIDSCKFFTTRFGTGCAIYTTLKQFVYCSNINEPRMKTAVEIHGLPTDAVLNCWTPIETEESVIILSSFNSRLFITNVETNDEVALHTRCPGEAIWDYMSISPSIDPNAQKLALFNSQQSWLWMGEAIALHRKPDLEVSLPKQTKPPTQIAWLGSDAVALAWESLLLIHSRKEEHWVKSSLSGPLVMLPEVDGIRMFMPDKHEFMQKVRTVSVQVLQTGSMAPGGVLNDAMKLYSEQEGHKADEYIRIIKEKSEIPDAVRQCVEAATSEIDHNVQKSLLKAATFGKSFLGPDSISEDIIKKFVATCKQLRVLNNIRNHDISIPLTFTQLTTLGFPELIQRLIRRRLFFLAHHISSYLELPTSLGTHKVLIEWATLKVQQQEPDQVTAKQILDKFRETPGISYSSIAEKARVNGRPDLATLLIDEEASASEQIPLLLDMGRDDIGLAKAISSGDPNLVYSVIFRLQKKLSRSDFLLSIRNRPVARNLYINYCKTMDKETLYKLYQQDDMFLESGIMRIEECFERETHTDKRNLLSNARNDFQLNNPLLASLTEDHLRLLEKQRELEDSLGNRVRFIGLTIVETLELCFANSRFKEGEQIRKEFRVSDNQFYWTKINSLAGLHDWLELEKLSRSKKPPVGFEPFVEACLKNRNRQEAIKYALKIAIEQRASVLLKCGAYKEAAECAAQCKDYNTIETILSKTGNDRALSEIIRQMLPKK